MASSEIEVKDSSGDGGNQAKKKNETTKDKLFPAVAMVRKNRSYD